MDQELNNSTYSVDLGYVKTPAEIIYDMSIILDGEDARNKRICLNLGNIDLNQSQILSIKSLINSINSTLSSIDTKSAVTEAAAMALGIVVSSSCQQTAQQEPEMTYKTVEQVIAETEEENEKAEIEENILPQEYNEVEEETEEEMPSTPREYEKLDDHVEESPAIETEQSSFLSEITINIPTTEEIKEELDTIFNTEKKLENIFDGSMEPQKEIQETYTTKFDFEEKDYTKEDIELESFPTKYIKQTIRSGQVINYEGNIVVIGDCHPGSEIVAAGDITVWGVLSGIAHAGSQGNEKARVRALKMNAIQLRVAQCYARRPDSLNIVFVEKTNVFTPEEARIISGEIVIFKIND